MMAKKKRGKIKVKWTDNYGLISHLNDYERLKIVGLTSELLDICGVESLTIERSWRRKA